MFKPLNALIHTPRSLTLSYPLLRRVEKWNEMVFTSLHFKMSFIFKTVLREFSTPAPPQPQDRENQDLFWTEINNSCSRASFLTVWIIKTFQMDFSIHYVSETDHMVQTIIAPSQQNTKKTKSQMANTPFQKSQNSLK